MEKLPQGNKRKKVSSEEMRSRYWSTHLQGDQSKAEKSNQDVDWLQKDLWYGSAILDSRLLENVLDIR